MGGRTATGVPRLRALTPSPPPPIGPLQTLNSGRRLNVRETAASKTEVNQRNQTKQNQPEPIPLVPPCVNDWNIVHPSEQGKGLRETATNCGTSTAISTPRCDSMRVDGSQMGFHSPAHPHHVPQSTPKKCRCPDHNTHVICEPNLTSPLFRPPQKHLDTATTTPPHTITLAIPMFFKRLLEPTKKATNKVPSPQTAPDNMEDEADSPSLRALFDSMEGMQEEMLEVKATAVCVWPAGAGSYLKGRVNERRDNTGDLIGLMKGALIPGSD